MADKRVHLVIPESTKVLIRSVGRVGVVSHTPTAPEHAYRVRFADGPEKTFKRSELSIFRHVQAEIPGAPDTESLLRFVQYRCIVGSSAYGPTQQGSDVDRRGFYLPSADLEWSLAGVPEQLETNNEEVYWELKKFIRLALKANPNVLECLYTPLVETCSPNRSRTDRICGPRFCRNMCTVRIMRMSSRNSGRLSRTWCSGLKSKRRIRNSRRSQVVVMH